MKECFECRKGEHETLGEEGEETKFFRVTHPETGRLYGAGYLCSDHEHCLLDDGYNLKEGAR